MSIMGFIEAIKQLARRKRDRATHTRRPRRRDPDFVGGTSVKDIEQAPPGRAQELAGHAVERVET
jgi:hypothetical protein